MITASHPGIRLAVGALVVFLLFIGLSAATAPPLVADATGPSGNLSENDSRTTLVGLQGPFREAKGFARLVSTNGSIAWQSAETWANFDVTPVENGRVLTAFIRTDATACGNYGAPCARTGFRIYDLRTNELTREWTYPVRTHVNREVHDVEQLPDGSILVVGMERERLFVVDPAGDITWQWNASEHYAPPPDPTRTDWLHMNDVDRIGADRYLVSVRNENQLLIVERGTGVVEVINEDGDPDVIDEQHNPQWLGEDRVLVADSGNDRVVELAARNGTWEVVWQLRETGGIGFHWPRDVDRLRNGNLLITDSFNDRVVEVTRNGSLVWSISPGRIPYEADRVPDGEYPNRTQAPSDAAYEDDEPRGAVSVPGLDLAYASVAGTLPVPYWTTRWHLLAFVGTVLTTIGGLVWAWME